MRAGCQGARGSESRFFIKERSNLVFVQVTAVAEPPEILLDEGRNVDLGIVEFKGKSSRDPKG